MDSTDEYIIAHSKSMSQQEMADKLGINKSTVSRRMAALRESGVIDSRAAEAAKRGARQARERLQGCTMSRTDRLEALSELKDMLHAELALAGGQGLARVSSEYRATIEQIESLSTELELTRITAQELNPVEIVRLKMGVRKKFAQTCERETAAAIVDEVLTWLADRGIVVYTPLDAATSSSDAILEELNG